MSPTSPTTPTANRVRMALLLGGRGPTHALRRHHVHAELDRRLLLHVGVDAALLVAHDGDDGRLAVAGDEGVARADVELVVLEVAEDAVAVSLIDELHGHGVRAGLDGAVVDVELGHLGEAPAV